MARTKVFWCDKCHADRVHILVDRKTLADGTGPVRGIVAIATLGMSETVLAERLYQCNKCGYIAKK